MVTTLPVAYVIDLGFLQDLRSPFPLDSHRLI